MTRESPFIIRKVEEAEHPQAQGEGKALQPQGPTKPKPQTQQPQQAEPAVKSDQTADKKAAKAAVKSDPDDAQKWLTLTDDEDLTAIMQRGQSKAFFSKAASDTTVISDEVYNRYHHSYSVWEYVSKGSLILTTCVCLTVFTRSLHEGLISTTDPLVKSIGIGLALIFAASIYFFASMVRGKRAERKLLQELFDGSRSARFVTDQGQRISYANTRFFNMVSWLNITQKFDGKEGPSWLRKFINIDEQHLEKFDQFVHEALEGTFGELELPSRLSDRIYWLNISAQPVAGREGCVHWRIDDVTEKHNVQMLVERERAKLLDFTDNAPVGFFSVDEKGRFLFLNETFARWLGYSVEDIQEDMTLHDIIGQPPENARPFDLHPDAGAKQNAELLMMRQSGDVFLASISQTVVHENDGKVRTRAVVHDMTHEREMRKALKESEDRFQKLFEEAPLSIVMISPEGKMLECNDSFAKMLNRTQESLSGKDFHLCIQDDDRARVMATISSIEEGKNLAAPVDMVLRGQGADVPVQLHARKFRGRNIVLYFIDLTQQRSLEAQFAQSQKMQAIGQLAGGVAHDFNNLLTAMIGFCDLLMLRHKAGDPSFNDIMQIKQNANRAANLVRQLLAFSRQQTLQTKVIDISDTLTELSHLIRRLLGVGIEFQVEHASDIALIKADEGQLEQVLINLCVNARDAMEGQGQLHIKTTLYQNNKPVERGADTMPAGEWLEINVSDSGSGIPQDIMERIFEPFFTTKEKGSGTGLGLATVYGIVRQTGGFVHVDSILGEGTSFKLYFPVYQQDASETAVQEQAEEEEVEVQEETKDLTGSATIMLVDDEDAVRSFGARALQNKGYTVIEASSGEEAWNIIQDDNPALDLIVTDVIMPEMDGPTFARHVLEVQPDLPIVFVSGYTEDRFKDEFAGHRVFFLPKPFTLQQLAERIKDVLAEG